MGEEKKSEENKMEEKKPAGDEKKEEKSKKIVEEKKTEELKDGKELKEGTVGGDGVPAPTPAPKKPPPPQEIVLKVYMHCEGCARKVRRCLKGFDGVEDVTTDCRTHKVIVKGEKADPLKVLERVQRKSHRQVELLSPVPKPAPEGDQKVAEIVKPKPEEKKEETQVIIVVFKIHMHCEGCAQQIKKRIQRMKGVESAEPDLKSSQVTVKGVFDPQSLVEYLYKRTGKQAVIVKQEPEKKEEEKTKEEKDEKKEENQNEKEKKEEIKEKKEDEENVGGKSENLAEETKIVELKRNEYYYYPPRYGMELYAYPPQIFSDETPNACSVM